MILKNKWNRLALFLLILGVNAVIFSTLIVLGTTYLAVSMDNPAVLRCTNSIAMVGMFGFTALLYAFIVNERKPFAYLKMDKRFKWETFLLLVLIFCASMPALSWVIKWNEGLHLPQAFAAIEQWMREQEETAEFLTKQMLSGTNLSVLFANLLAVAVVPAICEELFFRGVLLSWLKNSFRNKHLAVWLSAIVFSAIHVQFFGFFPRLLLGAYLGYLFVWTGSLWASITAHFLNNAVAVVAAYLFNIGYTATDYELFGNGGEKVWVIMLSVCVATALIWHLWKKSSQTPTRCTGK
ncbi:MAG: CPBP family intramembrane metalloprotease [Lentimicrobiaceae bacterium]|nr:CPBP family intramembrane metalloprotease [Lentimicrobiaceae bacterium]